MHEEIEVDSIIGEEVKVLTGRGTVAAVRAAGPPVGGGWPFYSVEIHVAADVGESGPVNSVITALVAANDPICQRAIDVLAFGRTCTWQVEYPRLPHIPIDRPAADLVDNVDTTALLIELDDVPVLSLALQVDQIVTGDDL